MVTTAGSGTVKDSLPASTSCFPVRRPSCRARALVQVVCGHPQPFSGGRTQRVTVPVRLLSAAEDQVDLFAASHLGDNTAHGNYVQRRVGLNQNGAIGSHRQGGAQSLLGARGPDGESNHLRASRAGFPQAQSFFDTVLIHGIQDQLAAIQQPRSRPEYLRSLPHPEPGG